MGVSCLETNFKAKSSRRLCACEFVHQQSQFCAGNRMDGLLSTWSGLFAPYDPSAIHYLSRYLVRHLLFLDTPLRGFMDIHFL